MSLEQNNIDFEAVKEWDAAMLVAYGYEMDSTNYISPGETSLLSKMYTDLGNDKKRKFELEQEYKETGNSELLEDIDRLKISILRKKIWLNSKY